MSISAFIAMRYSQSGTKQSFVAFINRFSIIGISLGIAALIIVASVMNGLESQLKQRILGILPHIVVEQAQPIDFPPALSSLVLAQVPFAQQEVIVQSRNKVNGLILLGKHAEANQYSIIANSVIAGNWDNIASKSFKVGISRILATKLGIDLGQELRLISTQASVYSPLGRLPSQRLVTVGAIFDINSEMDDKVIVMHLDDVARLSRKRNSEIQSTRLFLKDAFTYKQISDYLDTQNLVYETWRERQGPLFDAVKMEKNMMSLMLLLVIAVASFNVVSALVMVVSEKRADIAILQTQGMNQRDIMKIFLFNGVFNGLKGIVSGLILGVLGCFFLNDLLALVGSNLAFGENGQGLPIDIQYPQLIYISVIALVLCLLASWYPAYKAQSITPANSLRSE
ncbi:lipoprotein-releasing ABC transporter permease subunit [Glaciecola sp. 2405UD65-10]|uniref:lipoprotein-releasing ABC transporter permease subunit n=1 Tax=Glaciecola sp. 2405UD65-10 TaxID=3397244 RepID=UPI003B5B175A